MVVQLSLMMQQESELKRSWDGISFIDIHILWGEDHKRIIGVTVRPLCQIELGILGFRDLGQDYKDGFRRGVVPKGEIDHVRHHMTERLTSEDYTS